MRFIPHRDSTFKQFDGPGAIRYNEFSRQTGGKTRQISEPEPRLKKLQSRIAKHLSCIQPEAYLFCPAKGRNYIDNARFHSGSRMIRSLDIRKYFPSTTEENVYHFFRSVMLCGKNIAHALAKIATHNGRLPLGSPLSPILAHYTHYDVWEGISSICVSNGLKLSIYADDVTVSGHYVSERLFWEIKKIIFSSGLRYHKERLAIDRICCGYPTLQPRGPGIVFGLTRATGVVRWDVGFRTV